MSIRSTREAVNDLRQHGKLIVIEDEVDPYLEIAEIHRRVYRNSGPALLFNRVRNSRFPVATNLFGTIERARFLFRHTLDQVRLAVRIKIDPTSAMSHFSKAPSLALLAWNMRPKLARRGEVLSNSCLLSDLPQVTCWPKDGGAFVTLPQVISQSPAAARIPRSLKGLNLGMYRVQLNGNDYAPNLECGLHYQIHRGIGVHHAEAIESDLPLPVNVSVGGSPAMTLSAVMPLPEGMSELMFAGALAGHRIPMVCSPSQAPIYADADFCIVGSIQPHFLKPEGPFGDHLGYYARVHDFPVMQVQQVYHRTDAVWPMTVVGRPPQEDTVFGELIHELTGPVVPTVLPGVRAVHAVDAAGVHPLLLAIGSERYTPYKKSQRPQELLTQAFAILGQGQLSLAKYLWIIDEADNRDLKIDQLAKFLEHCLSRVDWRRDLHFHTCTTIDTLDYSGNELNQGSKLVIAASGPVRRDLPSRVESDISLPIGWSDARVALPGVLVVTAGDYETNSQSQLWQTCDKLNCSHPLNRFPLVVVVDNAEFSSRTLDNFLWTTFTRSNPATDVYGIGAWTKDKHFGCDGSLVIDARSKPHHAPPLIEDPATLARVDARAARGGELANYL